MLNLIRKFRNYTRKRDYIKLTRLLKKEEDALRKLVTFIVEQEQPMINTLTGHQREIEEAKLRQKIKKLTAKNHKKIDKIKEELEKMVGKMKLKEGKLVKAEDVVKEEVPVQMPQQEPAVPIENIQQPSMEQYAPQMMEQYVEEQQQPIPPPQMSPPQAPAQQPMPPPQMVQQPQVPPQEQLPETIKFTIRIVEGQALDVGVPRESITDFIRILNEAIDSQTILQLGSQVVNGRHIILYSFE